MPGEKAPRPPGVARLWGKTSPWISQPVPPTPIANEVTKNEKPTITSTVFGTPGQEAHSGGRDEHEYCHARMAPHSQRAATYLVDPAEGEVGRDHVDRAQDRRGLIRATR
jgi:hypothetical protein